MIPDDEFEYTVDIWHLHTCREQTLQYQRGKLTLCNTMPCTKTHQVMCTAIKVTIRLSQHQAKSTSRPMPDVYVRATYSH